MIGHLRRFLGERGWHPAYVAGYVSLLLVFIAALAQFHLPGKGFSYLITFGADIEHSWISKVRKLSLHVQRGSAGYDAQFYAQIAMDPSLQNRQLHSAVDNLGYRARRILLPAVAHVTGLGRPDWIIQAYALQNAAAWLALAFVLLHWFPPRDFDRLLRWAGVLFSFGILVSFRNALVDGPSLLLVAVGALLWERGRTKSATAVFALGGLAKETNLLAAAAVLPAGKSGLRDLLMVAIRGLLILTPLALWMAYLAWRVQGSVYAGERNFDLPFAAYGRKWLEIAAGWPQLSVENPGPALSLLMMLGLTAQLAYFVCRPQWSQLWWRIGASYAVLMIFLGDAVWEGYPGAASRVLLPMQLAFNVLVPAGNGWKALLIAGNLTLLGAAAALQGPEGEGYQVKGDAELLVGENGRPFAVEFDGNWHGPERGQGSYWVWSSGSGAIEINNPHPFELAARLRFQVTAAGTRELTVRLNGAEVWRVSLAEAQTVQLWLAQIRLPAGASRLEFLTEAPARRIGADPRDLAVCVHNLRLNLARP
jgi:hypothetical protein